MKWLFILVCIFTLCLIGCDPFRRINMENRSGEKAEIIWSIKKDSINSSPFFISNDREVSFVLRPNKPHNNIKMSFGYGTWHARQLQNLIDDLDSLTIRSKKGTQVYKNESEIRAFLMPLRKRIDKSKIVIRIEE